MTEDNKMFGSSNLPDVARLSDSSEASSDIGSLRASVEASDRKNSNSGSSLPSSQEESTSKHVTFGNLEVRKYPVILGDHPDCMLGPPLSIDWDYVNSSVIPVDVYESERPPRRHAEGLMLDWMRRKHILKTMSAASDEEMRAAASEALAVREQRCKSMRRRPSEYIEYTCKAVKRNLFLRFSSHGKVSYRDSVRHPEPTTKV